MKPRKTRIQKYIEDEPSGKSTISKIKREPPAVRFMLGIVFVVGSLALATWVMNSANAQRILYTFMLMACALMCMGVYMIKTLPAYKERFFTPRKFTTPVSPDGSKLENNSKQLQKQIEKEISKDTPEELKIKSLFLASIFVCITIAGFLDRTTRFQNFWFLSLFFSLFYLRKISWQMAWLADKIAVYLSILLLCLSLPVFYILQSEDTDFHAYLSAVFMLILTPVLLILTTSVVMHKLRKKHAKKVENENKAR